MTISLNRRFQNWFGLRVAYTLSKALDDAGNAFFFTPQDNFNLRDDRGLSDNDQRHRLTLSGTFAAPGQAGKGIGEQIMRGFQLSYIFSYGSSLPFNIVTGATAISIRTLTTDRSASHATAVKDSTMHLSICDSAGVFPVTEKLQLETLVEGFNVLNRANLQLPNSTFGPNPTSLPTFGKATAAADPRQIQFGLRLSF